MVRLVGKRRAAAWGAALGVSALMSSAIAGAPFAVKAHAAPLPTAGGFHSVADGTDGKVAGAAVPNIALDSEAQAVSAAGQLRAIGLNSVELDDWWQTASPTANTVSPSSQTISDSLLEIQIAAAEHAGLQVIVDPLFNCVGCSGEFRGAVTPSNPGAFFASYTAFIDHYAALAAANGATTLDVGSEMSSLEGNTAAWRGVIASARRLFHGTIVYEEDWSVLGKAQFLGSVDEIGLSAYFPLDPAASPSLGQLLQDWHSSGFGGWKGRDWVAAVAGLANKFHKPVVFGEAGYLSGDYAAAQPFLNYYSIPNETLQANLYQALLQTFEPYSWWKGVVWWDWTTDPDGPAANGRTFTGKAAEATLASWYGAGLRPDNPATPLP